MSLKPLKGIHHVSAITANAAKNYAFYTQTLGMRLVKKTINQDDPSVYHLFYADESGNPGTDLTFFEIPHAAQTYYGANSISATSLRVPSDEALRYWQNRLAEHQVEQEDITDESGRATLSFRDFEGQRLMLVSDEHNEGVAGGKPWDLSPVPQHYGVYGLGPVHLTVTQKESTAQVLTELLGFRQTREYVSKNVDIIVYETGAGGTGAEVHVEERQDLQRERPGRGSVHHVAFRVENEEQLQQWAQTLKERRIANSGVVERYYFKSLYFREPNGILYELATDGPGFTVDEPLDRLGERLALPPYFEDQREQIEANLKPLDTTISRT